MTIGEKIKCFRKEAGLTQKKLGEISGTSETTIKQYELGKRQPRIEQLEKIADALNLHILDLLDDRGAFDLYSKYDNAALKYYKEIGYELIYENNYIIISHNGYGYKIPNNIFLEIEDDLRLNAESKIEKIILKYKNTKFRLSQ